MDRAGGEVGEVDAPDLGAESLADLGPEEALGGADVERRLEVEILERRDQRVPPGEVPEGRRHVLVDRLVVPIADLRVHLRPHRERVLITRNVLVPLICLLRHDAPFDSGDRHGGPAQSLCDIGSLQRRMPRAGFEPAAYSLGGSRSIQLSYRGGRQIRGSAKPFPSLNLPLNTAAGAPDLDI